MMSSSTVTYASHALDHTYMPAQDALCSSNQRKLVMQAMQVQNHVWAPANMTVITAICSIPINMVLVRYFDFWGAALATSVARGLLLVLLCGKLGKPIQHMLYTAYAAHL